MPKLILTLFLCLLPFGLLANTPEESVADLQVAIDTKDLKLFEERINIDSILNQLFEAFVLVYQTPEVKGLLHPAAGLIYTALSDPNVAFAKKLIFDEAKAYIQDAVRYGDFSGKSEKKTNPQSTILAPLSNSLSKERKEIRDIEKAQAIDKDKTAYQIKFKVYDYENDQAFNVAAKMQANAKDWRIENIINLDELLAEIISSQKIAGQ